MAETVGEVPFRILPVLGDLNRPFWQGGEHGELRMLRCDACGYWVHPPVPLCPRCHADALVPRATSGRATVAGFTVNHQPWMPGPDLPYVVAIVELPEQVALRLMTNVVHCAPDVVRVGMPVRVTFEHHLDERGDVWIPLFEPDDEAAR